MASGDLCRALKTVALQQRKTVVKQPASFAPKGLYKAVRHTYLKRQFAEGAISSAALSCGGELYEGDSPNFRPSMEPEFWKPP